VRAAHRVRVDRERGSLGGMAEDFLHNWRGTIQFPEPMVVYRERSQFGRLLVRLKARLRRHLDLGLQGRD
jgi:hypothetical protein